MNSKWNRISECRWWVVKFTCDQWERCIWESLRLVKLFVLIFRVHVPSNLNVLEDKRNLLYTGCFRRNSKYFTRWLCGLFRVNTCILTCIQFSIGVEIQLLECYAWKTNNLFISFIGYVRDLIKLQQFKINVQKSHHRLQCTVQLSWPQYV
jgi:hypothetical protein